MYQHRFLFYHIKNLQSTKTPWHVRHHHSKFYHIKNLQSTKTVSVSLFVGAMFYHIKNLQSTKTDECDINNIIGFITLRIYKVLKP